MVKLVNSRESNLPIAPLTTNYIRDIVTDVSWKKYLFVYIFDVNIFILLTLRAVAAAAALIQRARTTQNKDVLFQT